MVNWITIITFHSINKQWTQKSHHNLSEKLNLTDDIDKLSQTLWIYCTNVYRTCVEFARTQFFCKYYSFDDGKIRKTRRWLKMRYIYFIYVCEQWWWEHKHIGKDDTFVYIIIFHKFKNKTNKKNYFCTQNL